MRSLCAPAWNSNAGTGQTGAVLRTPIQTCQADLGFGDPGPASLEVCGGDLSSGPHADLSLHGVPANGLTFLVAGLQANPTALLGGTLVPVPALLALPIFAGPAGALTIPGVPGGGGPASVYVQFLHESAALPTGYGISNAVKIAFLP